MKSRVSVFADVSPHQKKTTKSTSVVFVIESDENVDISAG